jgi:2-polyprenyl-3-methyl-5-hydroxy-6-metoxy-1,4-benzoquinol methylase
MNYRFAYAVGFHPWEDAEGDPPFAEKISEMFDREESGGEPPYGPALDLGTGSRVWWVQLAKRGWQVTGVAIVERALRRARDRVKNAGVDVRFPGWKVTDVEASHFHPPKILELLLKPDEHWCRLRRE